MSIVICTSVAEINAIADPKQVTWIGPGPRWAVKTGADLDPPSQIVTADPVINQLASMSGAQLVMSRRADALAIQRSVQDKLYDGFVSVRDFGAVGDGVTDDSAAVSSALTALFAQNSNTLFFPDGVYYLGSPVQITYPAQTYNRGVRLIGTAMAGFVTARPGGSRITGAKNIDALFVICKASPTAFGGFPFEVENIDFDGNGRTIGSAVLNTVGGGPARPFNVRSCNFRGFKKAICSDISASGLTTGICQVNIDGCNFQANNYALYAKGPGAIMGLRFVGNVCEMNVLGGIYGEVGAVSGAVCITDNLLEGQPDAINFRSGLMSGTISRNYFESNSGYLMYVDATNSSSVLEVSGNYMWNCAGAKVYFAGMRLNCSDSYHINGVLFDSPGSSLGSKFSNIGLLFPSSWSRTYFFDLSCCQLNTNVAPGLIESGAYVSWGSGVEDTPLGLVSYNDGTIETPATQASLAVGDAIVAVCLARLVSGTPTVGLSAYSNSGTVIGASPARLIPANQIEKGKWFVLAGCCKATASSTGAAKIQFSVFGGVMHITKAYTYKVGAPVDNSSPLYLYLPYASLLTGSASYDPPSLADGASVSTAITVEGAALGDFVESISFSQDLQGVQMTGWVSAANTVAVRFRNESGGAVDLASGAVRIVVRPHA